MEAPAITDRALRYRANACPPPGPRELLERDLATFAKYFRRLGHEVELEEIWADAGGPLLVPKEA